MNDLEWTVFDEGQLLDAMVGHKPVGVDKHFQMALIYEKFSNKVNKDVNPEKIWTYLSNLYNLEALDECESIPFPNNEVEFSLPGDEYGTLMLKRQNDINKSIYETPSCIVEVTPCRDHNTSTKEEKNDTERTKSNLRIRISKSKSDETPKSLKRPLRGSLKREERNSNENSSPTLPSAKRRRII